MDTTEKTSGLSKNSSDAKTSVSNVKSSFNQNRPNSIVLDLSNKIVVFDNKQESILDIRVELRSVFSRLPKRSFGFLRIKENDYASFLVGSVLFIADVIFTYGQAVLTYQPNGNFIVVTVSEDVFRELFSEHKYVNIEVLVDYNANKKISDELKARPR